MSESLVTKVKLLDKKASLPVSVNPGDAGYDLTFIGIEKIEGDVIFFKTGVSIQPPVGHYYEIVPRSSISKLPLEMANSVGIIDEGYRGEILVAVRVTHPNMGKGMERDHNPSGICNILGARPPTIRSVGEVIISKKPTLFQMILRKRLETTMVLVDDLSETVRGDGGFGSTDNVSSRVQRLEGTKEELDTIAEFAKEVISAYEVGAKQDKVELTAEGKKTGKKMFKRTGEFNDEPGE